MCLNGFYFLQTVLQAELHNLCSYLIRYVGQQLSSFLFSAFVITSGKFSDMVSVSRWVSGHIFCGSRFSRFQIPSRLRRLRVPDSSQLSWDFELHNNMVQESFWNSTGFLPVLSAGKETKKCSKNTKNRKI